MMKIEQEALPIASPVQRQAFKLMPCMGPERHLRVPGLLLWVRKRPPYCDRGEFELHAEPVGSPPERVTIDHADFFPRYFFSLEAMLTEIYLFLNKRGLWDVDDPPGWGGWPTEPSGHEVG